MFNLKIWADCEYGELPFYDKITKAELYYGDNLIDDITNDIYDRLSVGCDGASFNLKDKAYFHNIEVGITYSKVSKCVILR